MHPKNPRRYAAHRERGPDILDTVTWPKIAAALGLSIHTVKKMGSGPHRRFDPRNFLDVVRFVLEYRK